MSDAHKEALALGRERAHAVRRYLDVVARPKRRGRRVSVDNLRARLAEVEAELAAGLESIDRLEALARREHLQAQLAERVDGDAAMSPEIEAEFVKHAAGYGEAKGVSYAVWRQAGVPADVLKAAGIRRLTA